MLARRQGGARGGGNTGGGEMKGGEGEEEVEEEEEEEEEVVVVTGGGRGFGKCVAGIFRFRGARVAVLDLDVGEGEGEDGVWGFGCDVGDRGQVEKVWERIVKEVRCFFVHLFPLFYLGGEMGWGWVYGCGADWFGLVCV